MDLLSWTLYFILLNLSQYLTTACEDDSYFQCSADNRCIGKHELCDNFDDCPDGEDETLGCQMKFNCMGPYHFLCADRKCIPQIFRCDGVTDCEDQSDEQNCPANNTHCSLNRDKYLCKYQYECIDLNLVCDKKNDCKDESDEGGACFTESVSKRCHCDKCVSTPSGSACICGEGYRPARNNSVCQDINECAFTNICDHLCDNFLGSYKCSCHSSYALEPDGRTCTKIPELKVDDEYYIDFLYTTPDGITVVTQNNTQYEDTIGKEIVNSKFEVITLGTNYFAEISTYLNGTTRMVDFVGLVDSVLAATGLVDSISGFIRLEPEMYDFPKLCSYHTHIVGDYGTRRNIYIVCDQIGIYVCERHLILCSLIRPSKSERYIRSIALSPPHGLLFLMESTRSEVVMQIIRMSMNGANETVLLRDNFASNYAHHSLVVDIEGERLYYFNPRLDTIESLEFDGTKRKVIKTNVHRLHSLGVFGDQLVWSTIASKEIFACNKINGKNKTTVLEDKFPIQSITVNPPAKVRDMPICRGHPCSDLCLLSSKETRAGPVATRGCACPNDHKLSVDGISCLQTTILAVSNSRGFPNFLFVVSQLFSSEPKITRINLGPVGYISSMTYDPVLGNVFLFDSVRKILYSYNLKFHRSGIFSTDIGNITTMKYDGYSNALYLCNADSRAIEVLSLITSRKATLIGNTMEYWPTTFALASKLGLIFVQYDGTDGNNASFAAIMLNGTTKHFTHVEGKVNNMVVDEERKRLWNSFEDNMPNTLSSYSVKELGVKDFAIHKLILLDDNLADLDISNGKIFYTVNNSARVSWQDDSPHPYFIDLVEEGGEFLVGVQIKLASIPESVNTSSPCFINNGNCAHVCLIVNATTYAKRCLCELPYELASDGLRCIKNDENKATSKSISNDEANHTSVENKTVPKFISNDKANPTSAFTYLFWILLTSFIAATIFYIYQRSRTSRHPRISIGVSRARVFHRSSSVSEFQILESHDDH